MEKWNQRKLKKHLRTFVFLLVLLFGQANNIFSQNYGLIVTDKNLVVIDSALKVSRIDSIKLSKLTPNSKFGVDSCIVLCIKHLASQTDPPTPNLLFIYYNIKGNKISEFFSYPLMIEDFKQIGKFEISIEGKSIVIKKKTNYVSEVKIPIRKQIKKEDFINLLSKIIEL